MALSPETVNKLLAWSPDEDLINARRELQSGKLDDDLIRRFKPYVIQEVLELLEASTGIIPSFSESDTRKLFYGLSLLVLEGIARKIDLSDVDLEAIALMLRRKELAMQGYSGSTMEKTEFPELGVFLIE